VFNRTVSTVPRPAVEVEYSDPADGLIPLSHLELDFEAPPGGWTDAALAALGVVVHQDDLGRRAVLRSDARRLIAERREREARGRVKAEEQFAALAERFRPRGGFPAVSGDVHPTTAMLAAAANAARPRRVSVVQHALSNRGEIVIHPVDREGEEE
jgi:hypothetical protein